MKKPRLLQSTQFLTQLKQVFDETALFEGKEELIAALEKIELIRETDWSGDQIKSKLQNANLIEYSKTSPRGYSLNQEIYTQTLSNLTNPNSEANQKISSKTGTSTRKSTSTTSKRTSRRVSQNKKDLLLYNDFVMNLMNLFNEEPLINPNEVLLAKFEILGLPIGWTPNTTKNELRKLEVLDYSRKKPQGFSLNVAKLEELRASIPDEKLIGKTENPQELAEPVDQPPTKESFSPIQENTTRSQPRESKPKENKSADLQSKASYTTEEILNRIPSFAQYLLNRMSKDAQRVLRMGILEINHANIRDLEKHLDNLTAARMFFSLDYDNEKELLDYIDEKAKYISARLQELHENAASEHIQKLIIGPIKQGKFDKIINKWGADYGIEDCAWEILEKLGRKKRKIPLNEFALRKKVVSVLEEIFPEKSKK